MDPFDLFEVAPGVQLLKQGPYIWRDGFFSQITSCSISNNVKHLGPTIKYHHDQPLRRQTTPQQLQRQSICVEETDSIYKQTNSNYSFNITTPFVIESDYRGELVLCPKIAKTQIHAIIQNPMKRLFEVNLAPGENAHHFSKSFCSSVHMAVNGVIYQWKISVLEVIEQLFDLIQDEQEWNHVGALQMQKEWVQKTAARMMKAIQEYDLKHACPLALMKKDLLQVYLDEDTIKEGDELEFLYNMINARTVEVIVCNCHNFFEVKVATRFDFNNELFFAFGY